MDELIFSWSVSILQKQLSEHYGDLCECIQMRRLDEQTGVMVRLPEKGKIQVVDRCNTKVGFFERIAQNVVELPGLVNLSCVYVSPSHFFPPISLCLVARVRLYFFHLFSKHWILECITANEATLLLGPSQLRHRSCSFCWWQLCRFARQTGTSALCFRKKIG